MENNIETHIILNLTYRDTLQRKLNRLTPWQKLIVCAWLLGWSQAELAAMAQINEQNVSFTFVEAKKKMGVYWQTL